MSSGIDLGRLIPSVLFGFFIFAALTITFVDMGRVSGVTLTNATFEFNNTLTAAQNIENSISDKGGDSSVSSFFPGISTMFSVWNILKDTTTGVVKDMTQSIERFFYLINSAGGGSALMNTLKVIFVVCIVLSIAWVILAALFRQSGWKQQ